MKNIYITLILALLAGPQFAQTPIVVSYGPSYSQHDFYRLSDDQIVSVTNTDWEIAFLNAQGQFGPELAIHINEATRSNGTDVELYLSPSNDFNDPISPDDLVIRLFNPDTSWTTGAFNAFRDPTNPFDFGWGLYDASEHAVIGYEVFVVKLRDGSFRKIEIQEFRGTTFQFRWANLDGSNEKTQSLDLSDYPDSELILFSLRDESVAASPSGYDMVFTRYYHPLDDGNGGFLDYAVTGVLQGINVAVAKAVGVDPETVSFEDYRDSLDYHSDVIGFDWKEFSLGTFSWIVYEDRVYFIKDQDNKIWKVRFIDFEGSSTGNSVFTKEDLGITSATDIPGLNGLLISPNPASEECQVFLDLERPMTLDIRIFDLNGKMVFSRQLQTPKGFIQTPLDIRALSSGQYILTVSDDRGVSTTKLIVR